MFCACSVRSNVELSVEARANVAAQTTEVRVGRQADTGRTVSAEEFPMRVTVTSETEGIEAIWVEALTSSGEVIGRARVDAEFRRERRPALTVVLSQPCIEDSECRDQLYCNGAEACVDGSCQDGENPCPGSPFDCVGVSCIESGIDTEGSCDIQVDHESCEPIAAEDGSLEPTYCDTRFGCVAGIACDTDSDCDNEFACDGTETCLNAGRCIFGIPPDADDDNECTLDVCVEPDGASNLIDLARDGTSCTSASGEAGVCVNGECSNSICGDGIVDTVANEDCEDGNDNPNDGCADCRSVTWAPSLVTGLDSYGGDPTQFTLNFGSPIAVDGNGDLFVGLRGQVVRLRSDNGVLSVVAGDRTFGNVTPGPAISSRLNAVSALAVDGFSRLIVGDATNLEAFEDFQGTPEARIYRIDADSGNIASLTGPLPENVFGAPPSEETFINAEDLAVDGSGNIFYIASGSLEVRRIDAGGGETSMVAGGGFDEDPYVEGGDARNLAMKATGFTIDGQGQLFLADPERHAIFRIDPEDSSIFLVAGRGFNSGFAGEGGPAIDARFSRPLDVAVDSAGNLYVADSGNCRIRRIDAANGTVSTIAGGGVDPCRRGPESAIDGIAALDSPLPFPSHVVVDTRNNLYVSVSDDRVRHVDLNTGLVRTAVGTGFNRDFGDGRSATTVGLEATAIAVDSQRRLVFSASQGSVDSPLNQVVFRIDNNGLLERVAGVGPIVFEGDELGDGGPALNAFLQELAAVHVDSDGNTWLVSATRIRRIDAESGLIDTVAGGRFSEEGTNCSEGDALSVEFGFDTFELRQLASDSQGRLYFGTSNCLRRLRRDGNIERFAGGGSDPTIDGRKAREIEIDTPLGLAIDAQDRVYLTDSANSRVLRIDQDGDVTQLIRIPDREFCALSLSPDESALAVAMDCDRFTSTGEIRVFSLPELDATTVISGQPGPNRDGAAGSEVGLNTVATLEYAADGTIFVHEFASVRRLSSSGSLTTVAGRQIYPLDDGPLAAAGLVEPLAISPRPDALGGGFLIADGVSGRVRSMSASRVQSVVGYPDGLVGENAEAGFSRLLAQPAGVAFDTVNSILYISEFQGHTLRRVDYSGEPGISTFAGIQDDPGYGNVGQLRFNSPSGLALDTARGRLLVCDTNNHVLRGIDLESGSATDIAGTARNVGFRGDGQAASQALLNTPRAVAVAPDGSIYVADTGNHRVRRIDSDGVISTVVGDGTEASSGEGAPASSFPVAAPFGVRVDRFGNLFVTSTRTVRVVTSGQDGVATGEDTVRTIYRPAIDFPQSSTFCLSDLVIDDASNAPSIVTVLDRCAGYAVRLDPT